MYMMFQNCSSLQSLDLSNFNTSIVTNMLVMFQNCSNLTSILVNKETWVAASSSNGMFSGCGVSDVTRQ